MEKITDRATNITRGGERRRFWGGIIALILGVAVGAFFYAQEMGRWWRLALFIPFAYAAFGMLQAREKT